MKVLNDALLAFDPSYDPEIRSKLQIQRMNKIDEFMNSSEHCRISEYLLEFILCGVHGGEICTGIR